MKTSLIFGFFHLRCQNHLTLTKMIKNIDIEIDTWYINTALFGRGDAEIFEN